MKKEYYTALKKYLNATLGIIKLVDLDLRQYLQRGEDHVLGTPAIYIRFDNIEWTTLHDMQRAVMDFSLTLVSETAYGDDRDITDTSNINHLATENLIYQALMNKRFLLSDAPGYEALEGTAQDCTIIESIVRVRVSEHQTIDNLIMTTQSFRATVWDYTAAPIWQEILATLELDIKLTKQL